MKTPLILLLLVSGLGAAQAVEVAGVRFDENARLGNSVIVANGAGLRQKVFFKIYAMALYLPERQRNGAAVIAAKGAKRIAIRLLRDVTAQQFIDALVEGVAENHSESELAGLKGRIGRFSDAMSGVGEAKAGTAVLLDWIPGEGTRLIVDGVVRGPDSAGEDFFQALLRIWVGNKPVAEDLKQALLGKG